mgnify:CR=1 FL=1
MESLCIRLQSATIKRSAWSRSDLEDWYKITLNRLVKICKVVSSKYTRSKVRKALPKEFAYIIEEFGRFKIAFRLIISVAALLIFLYWFDRSFKEEDYGINLLPLATFAMEKYADDPCDQFAPKGDEVLSDKDFKMMRISPFP